MSHKKAQPIAHTPHTKRKMPTAPAVAVGARSTGHEPSGFSCVSYTAGA